MNRISSWILIGFLAAFGSWGCARVPAGGSEKVRALEQDLRSVQQQKEQVVAKLKLLESSRSQLESEVHRLQALVKEGQKQREESQKLVERRTQERDQLASQFDSFRKNLKDLIGQAEVGLQHPQQQPIPAPVLFSSQAR